MRVVDLRAALAKRDMYMCIYIYYTYYSHICIYILTLTLSV